MVESEKRSYNSAREALQVSGLFAEFTGPGGVWPVQAFGTLATGEQFCFTARAETARFTIRVNDDDHIAVCDWRKRVAEFPHASYLDAETCQQLILTWTRRYLRNRQLYLLRHKHGLNKVSLSGTWYRLQQLLTTLRLKVLGSATPDEDAEWTSLD